jgi:hypothetical protein
MKGLKKVHYLICSNKIDTLEPNPSAYSWKGGEILFFFHNCIKEENVERF